MSVYRSIVRPILFRLPAESAHELALRSLRTPPGAAIARRLFPPPAEAERLGPINRFGLQFRNPVGLAAGFDKNGVAAQSLAEIGFAFVEVGTVTSEPQPGNPKPRLFRLPDDRALINRLGFNNSGAARVAANLRRQRPACIVGVNIGKSRSVPTENAVPDYLASFNAVYGVSDYIAVNVSSPNTPGLRDLQRTRLLEELLGALQARNDELAAVNSAGAKPLLLKIAPDLNAAEIEEVVEVALRTGIAGLIATNTTVRRDGLRTPAAKVKAYGEGGLSGAPLRENSTRVIELIHRFTRGRLPVVGVGGIFTAEDAWQKICAGAGLVQVYTGFIYEGPGIVRNINAGLAAILQREGFKTLDDAVGCKAGQYHHGC